MAKAKGQRPTMAKSRSATGKIGKVDVVRSMFKMNTDLGQHVLKNPGVAQAIVDKADLRQSDTVLEVGPGTGNLTVRILQKAKKAIAVELDPRMAAELTKRVQGTPDQKRLRILIGDVVKTDLPYFDVCISNTPYQISSPLTFKLLATTPAPRVCILMFQREFAQRLVARPGDAYYSRLAANAQLWAHVDLVMHVGRNNFRPPPQVESSVVRLVPKAPRPRVSYDEWDGLLRVCFLRKNRMLRASFLGTTSVLDMLEANWRTWCAQYDVVVDEEALPDASGSGAIADDTAMAVDDGLDNDGEDDEMVDNPSPLVLGAPPVGKGTRGKGKGPKTKVALLVREKVRRVLEDTTKLAEKRARQCDQGDFLNLLWEFNKEGLHFA